MIDRIRKFNDAAVAALSHPVAVALWWVASAGTAVWSVVQVSMVAVTMALSFLALAYGSAIAERQLRTEKTDHDRDQALHDKINKMMEDLPEVDDTLAGCEPEQVG